MNFSLEISLAKMNGIQPKINLISIWSSTGHKNEFLTSLVNYAPSRKESPLDITANLKNANLKIVEPFIDDILSQIEGTISGAFKISGPLNAPQINGEGQVAEAQIMINYLKTMYKFTGRVGLTPSSIYFKDIELTDALRNKGKLNCTITHQNYGSMAITLDATFRNFQVLNTTIKDNSLFYGQAYATGDVNFAGPVIEPANHFECTNGKEYTGIHSHRRTFFR